MGVLIGIAFWVVVNGVHVAAHLFTARHFGVAVDRVTLGIGPSLWSRPIGSTTFHVALFPLALLVRLRPAWRPDAEGVWPPTRDTDLRNKSVLVRLAVFSSAPVALLVLAFVASYWMNSYERWIPSPEPIVGTVLEDRPAMRAGLVAGDEIRAIDGSPTRSWEALRDRIGASEGASLALTVLRNGEELRVDVTPKRSLRGDRYVVGIGPKMDRVPAPDPFSRLYAAAWSGGTWLVNVFEYFGAITLGGESYTLAGPVAIIEQVEGAPQVPSGFRYAQISSHLLLSYVLLCLFLPYLDGRRLFFLGVEVIARRPVHPKYEQWANRIGLGLVGLVYVTTAVRDALLM